MIENYTIDDFLGGKVKLYQPRDDGYRATSDSVLLAAAVNTNPNQCILEVGTGSGVVSCCINARVPGVRITAVEIQEKMAEYARYNFEKNKVNGEVIVSDIRKNFGYTGGSFDFVYCNPPFMIEDQICPNNVRDISRRESDCSLKEWIKYSVKYVKNNGIFVMINKADRITQIITALKSEDMPLIGDIKILPIYTKAQEGAKRVIVFARKGSKTPDTILPGIILNDENGRTKKAEEIMRMGQAL
ncbi:MAG: methyltransferase [Alphaproteobacteria bacterium]|nr:methyltransferase [Alphaproteobacteria bacterium]